MNATQIYQAVKLIETNFDIPAELKPYFPNFVNKSALDYITWSEPGKPSKLRDIYKQEVKHGH